MLEIFAQVPNSFRDYQKQIRDALAESPPSEVSGANYIYLEGCIGEFPNKNHI